MLLTGAMGTNLVYSKSQLGFTVLQLSIGYIVADFVFCCMDSNLRWDKASMIHHMAVIIGVWLVLYFQGKFMFFRSFSLHFRTLHTSCKHILGPVYPKSKRVNSVSI